MSPDCEGKTIIIKYAAYWQVQGLMEDTHVRLINCSLHLFRSSASSFSSHSLLLLLKSFYLRKNHQNNNVAVFQIPFHIFMPLASLWLIHLQGQFPFLRTRSCPDIYAPRRPLALSRRILFIGPLLR